MDRAVELEARHIPLSPLAWAAAGIEQIKTEPTILRSNVSGFIS
jgi:hypothetical protein